MFHYRFRIQWSSTYLPTTSLSVKAQTEYSDRREADWLLECNGSIWEDYTIGPPSSPPLRPHWHARSPLPFYTEVFLCRMLSYLGLHRLAPCPLIPVSLVHTASSWGISSVLLPQPPTKTPRSHSSCCLARGKSQNYGGPCADCPMSAGLPLRPPTPHTFLRLLSRLPSLPATLLRAIVYSCLLREKRDWKPQVPQHVPKWTLSTCENKFPLVLAVIFTFLTLTTKRCLLFDSSITEFQHILPGPLQS